MKNQLNQKESELKKVEEDLNNQQLEFQQEREHVEKEL